MAKQESRSRKQSPRQSSTTSKPGIIAKYPNGSLLVLLGLLLVLFFHQAFFSGKVFSGADTVVSLVYEPYIEQARQLGINTFWNPYIFSGMPTWGSHVPGGEFAPALPPMLILKTYGFLQSIVNIVPLPKSFWDIFNYFLLGLFTFLYCRNRALDAFPAFIAAVSIVFSLYTLNWIMGGHNTKITVFSLIPAALLLIDKLFEKRSLLSVVLLALVFHLQFNAAHLQIIFYSVLTIAFYFLFKLYEGEKLPRVLLVGAITVGAAVLAFAMLSQNYFGMWEYKTYSIREAGSGGSDTGAKGGLDYDYATNWSFSLPEIITFFVPSFVGFGIPTYWGGMPFTESPIYLGIVISTLALFGIIFRRKDKFVHFWIFLGVFSLLLSLGKEFPLLYNIFFNHVPFFNNFRIPSMVLCILVICMGMLGAVGIQEIIGRVGTRSKSDKPMDRFFLRGLIATAAILLLFIIGRGAYESIYISAVKSSGSPTTDVFTQVEQALAAGQSARIPDEYKQATFSGVFNMAYRDTIIACVFLTAIFALLWAYSRKKLTLPMVQFSVIALLIIDLWIVDYRPMKMVNKREQEQLLQETDFVRFLKQDQSPYRILPIQIHNGDNWFVAFGIQNIAGYHPAKLKLYDDVRNTMYNQFEFQDAKQFSRVNMRFLDMLNMKYVLAPFPLENPNLRPAFQGEQALIYENSTVLPRAFFVPGGRVIEDDKNMFAMINSPDYDPSTTAYLSAPLPKIPRATAEEIARTKVRFTNYEMNGFTLKAETPVEAILKLGEIYYPSGWKATIDGSEVPILRTDYCLRAIVVPPGSHTITFSFEPRSYKAGLVITTITNYLVGVVLLVYLGLYLRRRFFTGRAAHPGK